MKFFIKQEGTGDSDISISSAWAIQIHIIRQSSGYLYLKLLRRNYPSGYLIKLLDMISKSS